MGDEGLLGEEEREVGEEGVGGAVETGREVWWREEEW